MPLTNQAKKDYLNGTHASGNTYKIALFTSSATITTSSTSYSSLTNEVANGNGYTTGGATLAGYTVGLDTNTGYLDWSDASWGPGATITARYAVVYNDTSTGHGTVSKPIIAYFDFGSDVSCSNGTLTLTIPASGNGLIRIT
jgi:hypothetical protein